MAFREGFEPPADALEGRFDNKNNDYRRQING